MNDKGLWIVWLSIVFTALAFFITVTAHAECDSDDPNMKTIKQTIQDIRTIAAYPDMVYIRLHDKERENIKKRLPYEPNLELFLK